MFDAKWFAAFTYNSVRPVPVPLRWETMLRSVPLFPATRAQASTEKPADASVVSGVVT
jgi:hypothetical protein